MSISLGQASGTVLVRHHCPYRMQQASGTILVALYDGNFVGTPVHVQKAVMTVLVAKGETKARIQKAIGTILVSRSEKDIRPATDAHFCRNHY